MNQTELSLKELISKEGAISLEKFTEICVRDYYSKQNVIGKKGDFVTAPEISQVFGELIGLWCITSWEKLGRPEDFCLIEFGPGNGTLMLDALRAIESSSPRFIKSVSIILIETSKSLSKKQKTRLSKYKVNWLVDYTQIPKKPTIIFGNEFLDTLPVRQFIKVEDSWHERLVTFEKNQFLFTLSRKPSDCTHTKFINCEEKSIFEYSHHITKLTEFIANHFLNVSGIALFIDYGYIQDSKGDTLQAIRKHKFSNVLENPGNNDLTAHVNFSSIKKLALKNGNSFFGPIEQGEWLTRLGIHLRIHKLIQSNIHIPSYNFMNDLNRLINPRYMGKLFKVISFSSPSIRNLEGF